MSNPNTVKLHFRSAQAAQRAAVDGVAYAGERAPSGRVRTWIAHVVKATPTETQEEAAARFTACGYPRTGA